MLFVQRERSQLTPELHYQRCAEGIMLLWEYHCCMELGKAPGSMCLQVSLAYSQHWWNGPYLQLLSIARVEKGMLRGVSSSLGEVAVGKHNVEVLALWGRQQPHKHLPSHPVWPKGPLTWNKISVQEVVLVHVTVGLVCVVNILDNLNIRGGKRRSFYCIVF